MKKSHRLQLEAIPGFYSESGALKFRHSGADCIGRNYEKIERQAYPPMSAFAQAELLTKAAEHQNQMFAKLQPKLDAILNNPNDPRAQMMQQLFGTLGGMPAPHDTDAMRKDILSGADISQPESNYNGIGVDLSDTQEPPMDAAKWLSDNFDSFIPGFIEAAKYAYSRLQEESLSETVESAYIVDNPSDRDYLDRIRILSVEIGANRRYVFSLEAPSAHLEEHGMYAVFEESNLLVCGEYDILEELEYRDSDGDEE